jgi:hypothetical protein
VTADREQQLLNRIPLDGTSVGNTRLMRELRWSENDFWEIRNRLVDRGELELGRGRGGSVRRVVAAPAEPLTINPTVQWNNTVPEEPEQEIELENSLYPPLLRVLEERWIKDQRVESSIVQQTAHQGRKLTGGRWTRPDVTIATLSTYPYVPGRHFDVVTFEVKHCSSIDVICVYEALAHLRSATRAYVLLHVPKHRTADLEDTLLEVCAEAKKHGIGVLVFEDAADYETWDERVEPVRREPEARRLNDFLARQFTQEQLEKIVRWFR